MNKKTLILFYSFSGNNKALALKLGQQLHIGTLEIIEKKKRNHFTFIRELVSKKLPLLKEMPDDLDQYEQVIIITPVWFGKIATPVLPVIKILYEKGIPYDLISLRGGHGDDSDSMFNSITKVSNHLPLSYYNYSVLDYSDGAEKNVTKIKVEQSNIAKIAQEIVQCFTGV